MSRRLTVLAATCVLAACTTISGSWNLDDIDVKILADESEGCIALAVNPADERVAVAFADGTLRVYQVPEQSPDWSFVQTGKVIRSLAFSPDGSRLAAVDSHGVLTIFTRPSEVPLQWQGDTDGGGGRAVVWAPDGSEMAVALDNRVVGIGLAEEGLKPVWTHDVSGALALAYGPGARTLAAGGAGSQIPLVDLRRNEVHPLAGSGKKVTDLAFSTDGSVLAASDSNGHTQLWDVEKGQVVATLAGHEASVTAVDFSPSGEYIATAGQDGIVFLWDALSYEQLARLDLHRDGVTAMGFGAGGQFFLAGDSEGELITVYGLTEEWVRRVKRSFVRQTAKLRDDMAQELGALVEPRSEFESSDAYQKRLGRAAVEGRRIRRDYARRMRGLRKEVDSRIDRLLDTTRHPVSLKTVVGPYDADMQNYRVAVEETGTAYTVKVPLAQAKSFKKAAVDGNLAGVGLRKLGFDEKWRFYEASVRVPEDRMKYSLFRESATELLDQPPPRLEVASVNFDDGDGNGNRLLEAEERANVFIKLQNTGKGVAPGIRVQAQMSGAPARSVEASRSQWAVTELAPGGSVSLSMELSADELLPDGRLLLRIEAEDEMGFASAPVEYALRTVRLPDPDLVVARYRVNDGVGEYAQGDDDRVVEPGEGIEMHLVVLNRGTGVARAVATRLRTEAPGILLSRTVEDLGDIQAGDSRSVKTAFKVPTNYQGPSSVSFTLEIGEQRQRFSRNHELKLELGALQDEVVLTELSGFAAMAVKSDVDDLPGGRIVPRPGSAALVIGISSYKNFKEVFGARRDAETMALYLREVMGFENVRILTDGDATRGLVASGVRKWLAGQVRPDGDLLVYFAGHGAVSIEGKQFLMLHDASPEDVTGTGYDVETMLKELQALPAANRIFIADACYPPQGDDRPIVPVRRGSSGNVALLRAAGPDQVSNPFKPKGHGLFTYYLLKGLSGDADEAGDRDGHVTLGELFGYARDEVKGQARKLQSGTDQVPEFDGPEEMKQMVLSRPQ